MQAMFIIATLCPVEPCRLSDAELDRIYGNEDFRKSELWARG
jgi:hypothetical protein